MAASAIAASPSCAPSKRSRPARRRRRSSRRATRCASGRRTTSTTRSSASSNRPWGDNSSPARSIGLRMPRMLKDRPGDDPTRCWDPHAPAWGWRTG
ncbi:hypothetical protein WR25_14704 [Diploscapter pachys]|uniref:Uncharacterized protein n=1 Tax=Diploscapter pachys TaxID=2018661 RepID=A0A2A2M5W5_9BILA|nr:hypothetical protein WR25_14704 [Diploscapter pachys]